MPLGVSYKQQPVTGSFDAVVIGSGMGGLTTAAILAKRARKRVLVLERHYQVGGFTHSFTRPGYEWDVGLHYVGEAGPLDGCRPIFDYLSDGNIDWAAMPDVYDRVHIGDRTFDFVSGKERLRGRLKSYFPHGGQAIDRYFELVSRTTKAAPGFFLDRVLGPRLSALASPLLRAPYLRLARRTTGEVMSELTSDRLLAGVLTAQYGDYGMPPSKSSFAIHATVAAHFFGGGYYPVGGSGAIARAIVPVIERAGGRVYVHAEVDSVIVEGGTAVGVRMTDGREIRAPMVISDAGAANTFNRLVPRESAPRPFVEALRALAPSTGHLCIYLGYRKTAEELGFDGTNVWLFPNEDHDANFQRFFRDPEADFPLAYVSFPSAKDSTFAERFPGRSTVEVVTLTPFEWFRNWQDARWRRRGEEYEAFKARLADRLLDLVAKKMPKLRENVDVMEVSSPLSTRHFAAHPVGEMYGLDHGPDRYRLPIRARTAIRGLFLTGQDIAACGVAGAMVGGLVCAGAILGPHQIWSLVRGR